MFKIACGKLGFRSFKKFTMLTINEYNLILKGVVESQKEDAELELHLLKKAITESLTGKHSKLFNNENKTMTKEQNEKSFKELFDKFNKKR